MKPRRGTSWSTPGQAARRSDGAHQRLAYYARPAARTIEAGDVKELGIVIKADVQGSVEVLSEMLPKLSTDQVKLKIIGSGSARSRKMTCCSLPHPERS